MELTFVIITAAVVQDRVKERLGHQVVHLELAVESHCKTNLLVRRFHYLHLQRPEDTIISQTKAPMCKYSKYVGREFMYINKPFIRFILIFYSNYTKLKCITIVF